MSWAKGRYKGNWPPDPKERLLSYLDKRQNGCWLFTGARCGADDPRYPRGAFFLHGKAIMAHRAAFVLFKGEIPAGKVVMHSCDNALCCNPKHLSLGTPRENTLDMVRKGRDRAHTHPESYPVGKANHKAKLTEKDVRAIRSAYAKGDVFQKTLARQYGVAQTLISCIVRRENWRHVT